MKIISFISGALLTLSIVNSQQAHAWGQTGHRVTGQIAEVYLSENAKVAIESILDNESLAEISTYPDEMRSSPSHFWQKVAGPFHYVTVPEGKTYSELQTPPQGDSFSALSMYKKVLQNTESSRAQKQLALKMIVHIIGDLHQPLHAGNGTDRGGNDFKLSFFRKDSNLHGVWDSGLIDQKQLSFSEWTAFLLPKISNEQAKAWNTADPLVYIQESIEIRDTIYPSENDLSWQYLYDHTPTVKLRLQQAGVRIAAYLNNIYR